MWDDEVRFELTDSQHNKTLKLSVLDETEARPELIGDTLIQLDPAIESTVTDGYDEWHELTYKGKYAGEVYLEMTFYPSRPALPQKHPKKEPAVQINSMYNMGSLNSSLSMSKMSRPLPDQPGFNQGAAQGPLSTHHPRMMSIPQPPRQVPLTPGLTFTSLPAGIKYAGPSGFHGGSGSDKTQSPSRPALPYPVDPAEQFRSTYPASPKGLNFDKEIMAIPLDSDERRAQNEEEAMTFFSTPLPPAKNEATLDHEYQDMEDYIRRGSQRSLDLPSLGQSTSSSEGEDLQPKTPLLGSTTNGLPEPGTYPASLQSPTAATTPETSPARKPVKRKPIRKPVPPAFESSGRESSKGDSGESPLIFSPDSYVSKVPSPRAKQVPQRPDDLNEDTFAPEPVFMAPAKPLPRVPGDLIDPGMGGYLGEGQWDLTEQLNEGYSVDMCNGVIQQQQQQQLQAAAATTDWTVTAGADAMAKNGSVRRKPRVPPKIPVGMTREEFIASEYGQNSDAEDDGLYFRN